MNKKLNARLFIVIINILGFGLFLFWCYIFYINDIIFAENEEKQWLYLGITICLYSLLYYILAFYFNLSSKRYVSGRLFLISLTLLLGYIISPLFHIALIFPSFGLLIFIWCFIFHPEALTQDEQLVPKLELKKIKKYIYRIKENKGQFNIAEDESTINAKYNKQLNK
ncbi:hypothetical protein [Laceyella putida]|uniref:Uncharacterized protein n=1 Tax=Laceyella putida TaxID=110101 RepID=A0ABW2RND8_9BACL